MRTECYGSDALVAIGAALGWDGGDGLKHVATCRTCQDALHELSDVHGALDTTEDPGPGFADAVVTSLLASAAARAERVPRTAAQVRGAVLIAALAAAGCFAIAIGQAPSTGERTAVPTWIVAIILSLAVGVVAGWRTLRSAPSG